jgi:hypothetical protein
MPDSSLTLHHIIVTLLNPIRKLQIVYHSIGARMQRAKRFIAVLIITGLAVFTPSLAMSELDMNVHPWSNVFQREALALRFANIDSRADTTEYLDTDSPSSTEMGYWFEEVPWLGVTSETSLSTTNEVSSETSIDADADFDPVNSFILLRYPNGSFQPFVGVGPTFLISDFATRKINSLHHLFMGFHYTF